MKIKIKDLRRVISEETQKLHEGSLGPTAQRRLSKLRDSLAQIAAEFDGVEDTIPGITPELEETLHSIWEDVYGAHVTLDNLLRDDKKSGV
jgi:hypothetical protein